MYPVILYKSVSSSQKDTVQKREKLNIQQDKVRGEKNNIEALQKKKKKELWELRLYIHFIQSTSTPHCCVLTKFL